MAACVYEKTQKTHKILWLRTMLFLQFLMFVFNKKLVFLHIFTFNCILTMITMSQKQIYALEKWFSIWHPQIPTIVRKYAVLFTVEIYTNHTQARWQLFSSPKLNCSYIHKQLTCLFIPTCVTTTALNVCSQACSARSSSFHIFTHRNLFFSYLTDMNNSNSEGVKTFKT